jgi:cell wall assembly regulator SMI1
LQKFTRPLTREVEIGGSRLALTLGEQGITIRPVGSRKPPFEISWAALLCHVTGQSLFPGHAPTAEQLAEAVNCLKQTPATKPSPSTEPAAQPGKTGEESRPAASGPGPEQGEVAALLARLEQWFRQHRARYARALLPGATPAELAALQQALGMPLPEELKALLQWHNGQSQDFDGHLQLDWDLLSTSQIAAAKHDLDAGDRSQTGWQPAWIPFLGDDADDFVCLDTSQPGNPVREFWQGRTDHPVTSPSLAAWLRGFVEAVERGDYREDPERGSFLPRRG